MADNLNIETPAAIQGAVATDEISAAHYQRVKLIQGADGVNDGDVSIAAPLNVADRNLEISRGNVTGQRAFRKFGANRTVTTADEVISSIGGQLLPWMPTAAVTVEIVSSDAADGVAGAGALTVRIIGLDASFEEIEEVVTMNGTAAVVTTASFIRVYRAYVETVGTYRGSNTGTLTIREVGGAGDDILQIDAEGGQTLGSHYTVPAGKTLFISNYFTQIESNKAILVHFIFAPTADDVTTPFAGAQRILFELNCLVGVTSGSFAVPQVFPEKSDVWATAIISAGSGSAFFEYSGVLIDD
jgi:hypothetical protein